MFALIGCSQTGNSDTATAQTDSATTTVATETTATAAEPMTSAAPPPAEEKKPMSDYENKVAELHTTAGQINIKFYPDVAPGHVQNFIDLSTKGFYDGTKFHRVIPGFMIQGGDPNTIKGDPRTWGTGGNGQNYVKAEFSSITHKRGIVSMARASDPNSASSQFFIVVADSKFLDNNYSVFGEVTKGMDVADKIVNAQTGPGDRPLEPTTITKVVVRDATAEEKAQGKQQ